MKQRIFAATTALALTLSPAFANTENEAQLAAALGVDPEAYTLEDLVLLNEAVESDDFTTVDQITDGRGDLGTFNYGVTEEGQDFAAQHAAESNEQIVADELAENAPAAPASEMSPAALRMAIMQAENDGNRALADWLRAEN